MENQIKTQMIASGFARSNGVILNETPDTCLVFQPEIYEGGVRGHLVRFKKERGQVFEKIPEVDFRRLKLYEGVNIEIGTSALLKLTDCVDARRKIVGQGVQNGTHTYTVIDESKLVTVTEQNKFEVIRQLLSGNYPNDFWNELKRSDPELATKLSSGHIHAERKKVLDEFRESVDSMGEGNESYWQDFFETNKWIFGYGLNYKILKIEQHQPNFGGAAVDGRGGEKGDMLCVTDGDIGFTVLVEIKTPATSLLKGATPQRNGAWSIASELTDGITQLQANCCQWNNYGSRLVLNVDKLESKGSYTTAPSGILVIGRLAGIASDRVKRDTFQRFRQSITGLEILTFDELLKRAEFILS